MLSTPATTNPLGVKGTGEAGTTAAIAALMNAIAHAIPNGAADHMDMPATPAKVWAACQKGMAKWAVRQHRSSRAKAGTQPFQQELDSRKCGNEGFGTYACEMNFVFM